MTTERERLLAHYYDLEYQDYDADVDFFANLVATLDPSRKLPVLDLGCGTGRVALSLANVGVRVTCLDSSEAMLEACAAAARERGLNGLITMVHADMSQLHIVSQGPHNLAVCALNSFAYLLDTETQLAMLNGVKPLLVQHGILVLDLTPPWPHLLPPEGGELVHQGTYPASNGAVVHKFVTGYAEASRQLHHVTLIYDREEPDGVLTRLSEQLDLRWTGRYEMELLLRLSGYTVESVYGSYALDDFGDDSERMIFVART